MKHIIKDIPGKSSGKNQENSMEDFPKNPGYSVHHPLWQRIILLIILGYEGAGALAGGILLVIAPDGRLMDMPVDILHNVFPDFLIPGLILIGLGILNTMAFIAVMRRTKTDWIFSSLAQGGLAIWFIVEIIILQEFHWLHAMWGIPVLVGCLVTLPLVLFRMGKSRYSHID